MWAKAFSGFLNYSDKSNVAAGRENLEKLSKLVLNKANFSNFIIHRYEAVKETASSNNILNKWSRISNIHSYNKGASFSLFYLKKGSIPSNLKN